MSYPDVNITNSTKFSVTGTVHYAACSSDNFNLSTGTNQSFGRGVCLVTEITAEVYLPSGKVAASSYESSGTSYSQYAVIEQPPGSYKVSRVVTLVGNNSLVIDTKLNASAKAIGITPQPDIEATALSIVQHQEQHIENMWPTNYPNPTISQSAPLLCGLRESNGENEKSCVSGSLQTLSTQYGLGLTEDEVNNIAGNILKAMVKGRFNIPFEHGTIDRKSQTLYWGISVNMEPIEGEKDFILYTIKLAVK